METRRLTIADGSEEFTTALAEALRGSYELRICRDGIEALENIRGFKPDILVLDLMLPGLDGISLLESVADQGLHPMVLATSRFVNDYVIEAIDRLGVSYIMQKPCHIGATVERIADLSQRLHQPQLAEPDPRATVSNILLALGIPAKLRGYAYLREAVVIMAERPGLSVTKELYPDVGIRCDAEPRNVERSIRSAIEAAWNRRNERIWQMYLGAVNLPVMKRPSNAELISLLAERLAQNRINFPEY